MIRRLRRVGAGAGTGAALAFEVLRVGLAVAGTSSSSLAADDASDGAGDSDGLRDVELAALADRRGGIWVICTNGSELGTLVI